MSCYIIKENKIPVQFRKHDNDVCFYTFMA